MKRAAAIIGATPSFVRWTIRHACPFRQLDDSNQPYEAFRQLRSLREVSLAVIEDRIQSGFCVHSTENQDPATARGFPVDEVMTFFGGIESAYNTCGVCPANAAKHRTDTHIQPQWAGCYGWTPSQHESVDLVATFNAMPQSLIEKMPNATDAWHRIWQIQRWDETNIPELQAVFSQLPEETAGLHPELADLRDAVNACVTNKMILENELIPSGVSDGIKWTLAAHCSICKFESTEATKACVQCGQEKTWVPASSRKVLGLRPYMILQSIIGITGTQQLLQDLHHKQTGSD